MTDAGPWSRLLPAALALVLAALPAAALEVPFLTGRVNDLAGLLSPEIRQELEARLEALEKETGAQVAILTIPGLEGEALEDYSLRVAETWKLGRAGVDDGALLLIARDDRKMRLEVGYGLEPVVTDILAGRILDGILRPRFREGDFDRGLTEAVEALSGLIRGDGTLPPPEPAGSAFVEGPLGMRLFVLLVFFFVVGMFSLNALFAPGCGGWFLYVFLIPFWGAFPISLLGMPAGAVLLAAWVLGFPILRLVFGRTRKRGLLGKLGAPLEPPSWWSSSRGWSSGGGFSGGGFSGGGGSFGGGGASSSW